MPKNSLSKVHTVSSTNGKSIQFRPGSGPNKEDVIRVAFQRPGAPEYDYFPCTKEEFEQGKTAVRFTDWFNDLKAVKQFKKVE